MYTYKCNSVGHNRTLPNLEELQFQLISTDHGLLAPHPNYRPVYKFSKKDYQEQNCGVESLKKLPSLEMSRKS
jgi:hypothetical protein